MRVLHVDTGREWRGGQTQMRYLVERAEGEHHVVLPVDAPLGPVLEEAGIRVHRIDFKGGLRGFACLREVVKVVEPDLLAAHTAHAHTQCLLAAGPLPVVVHRRVDFAVGGNLASKAKYRAATGYIAVSDAVRQVLEDGGVDGGSIEVVHDGVDPEPPAPAGAGAALRKRLGIPAEAPVIASLGALVPHKGHIHLAEALAWLDNKRQDVWAILAGEGPERAGLEAKLREWGIDERTLLPGELPRAEVLAAADLFCHPSVEEGLGQAVLEAMLAGVPVVASNAGGLGEVIEDMQTGMLVRPGDGAALSRALLACLQGPERARERAHAARTAVAGRFGIDAMVQGTLAAYDRFLGR